MRAVQHDRRPSHRRVIKQNSRRAHKYRWHHLAAAWYYIKSSALFIKYQAAAFSKRDRRRCRPRAYGDHREIGAKPARAQKSKNAIVPRHRGNAS